MTSNYRTVFSRVSFANTTIAVEYDGATALVTRKQEARPAPSVYVTFRGPQQLANAIYRVLDLTDDIGSSTPLRTYEKARRLAAAIEAGHAV